MCSSGLLILERLQFGPRLHNYYLGVFMHDSVEAHPPLLGQILAKSRGGHPTLTNQKKCHPLNLVIYELSSILRRADSFSHLREGRGVGDHAHMQKW